MSYNRPVGELIRIEWNQDTGEVRIVLDITDQDFKSRVLHNKEYSDIITIVGREAILVEKSINIDKKD